MTEVLDAMGDALFAGPIFSMAIAISIILSVSAIWAAIERHAERRRSPRNDTGQRRA